MRLIESSTWVSSQREQQISATLAPARRGRARKEGERLASAKRYDQFRRMAAPVDGNDKRPHARRGRNIRFLACQHARHGDDEVSPEILARIAGDGVGHLTD